MKQFSIYSKFLLVIALFGVGSSKAQIVLQKLEYDSHVKPLVKPSIIHTSPIKTIPDSTVTNDANNGPTHQVEACAAPGNDNFSNATVLTVNGPAITGTTCGGTLQASENIGCTTGTGFAATSTVWYQFTASSATQYVTLDNTLGGVEYLSFAVWAQPAADPYPEAADCNPIECNFQQTKVVAACNCVETTMELTNGQITAGNTYYIQVGDLLASDASSFNISVSTASPGGNTVVTNPGLSNITFASPTSSCFLTTTAPNPVANVPPCAAENISDPPYPDVSGLYLNHNGCRAAATGTAEPIGVCIADGYVYTNCMTVTNPTMGSGNTFGSLTANWSYVYNQLVTTCYETTDNLGGNLSCAAGNALWSDWEVWTSTGSPIACGNGTFTASTTNITGLGCTESYVICFQFESGCDMVTSTFNTVSGIAIWPYMSWEASGQSPCATNALPISLLNFQVNYDQPSNDVTVYWATSSQVNNRLFTVEKSVDGFDFQTVKEVAGAGNSTDILYYSVDDESPWAGISYYRLKQTDYDGHETYSEMDPVEIPADYSANIFPNPTSGNMTLRYTSQSPDPVNIKITDVSGSVIASYTVDNVSKGINNLPVYTQNLGSGMYIMQVSNYQKTFFLKFIKQ